MNVHRLIGSLAGLFVVDYAFANAAVPLTHSDFESTASYWERSTPPMQLAVLVEGGASEAKARAIEAINAALRKKDYDAALKAAAQYVAAYPKDPAGYNLQGAALLAKGDVAGGRKNFQAALDADRNYVAALMNLAQLDARDKNFDGARTYLDRVLVVDPKNLPALLAMAHLEPIARDRPQQMLWLQRAKEAQPGALPPRLQLAKLYLEAGDTAAAQTELAAAQQAQPNNADVLTMLGRVQAAAGQHAAALATFNKVVALQPTSATAWKDLGSEQAAMKDTAAATASIKKALALDPKHYDAIVALAILEVRARRYAEAVRLAKQLQALRPADARGALIEGDIWIEQKRYAEAAAAFDKALTISPTGMVAIKLHGARRSAGRAAEADAALAQWINAHPDDAAANLHVAGELARSGKSKEAIERYEAILRKDPRNVMALNNLAALYQRESNPRAMSLAEEAYKLAPDSPTVADTYGWILVEQGTIVRGLEVLKRAAASAPDNLEIRYHLAAGLAKFGDKAGARQQLEIVLRDDVAFPEREAARRLMRQL